MTDYHQIDALMHAMQYKSKPVLLGMDVQVSPHIDPERSKRISAHPIVCWLSQFLACFGCRLDPWVDVPIPVERRTSSLYLYEGRLIMSPSTSLFLANVMS